MGITAKKEEKKHLLSHEETLDLIQKVQNGDEEAKALLISSNLGLVRSVIGKFSNIGYERDDLFQLGSIGLIKAIYKFDPSYNVKFSTYAVPMILGEIKRYLRDNNSIRVSRSVRDLAYKAMQFKEKYIKQHGKEPTILEIAKELEVEQEDVSLSLDAIQDPVSLQEPVYNDGTESIYLMDQVKDTKNTDEFWVENMTIMQAMKKLNDKEKMIINKRFFDGRTQMEVANEIGISQAQVSRLEKSAIAHIKKTYK
jgi:RNA polymerase sporulation-specific sigma factor